MRNKTRCGVVEDIRMNTPAGSGVKGEVAGGKVRGAGNRIEPTAPKPRETPSEWGEIEQANSMLNPDPMDMERG
jgi:hypothetical protein